MRYRRCEKRHSLGHLLDYPKKTCRDIRRLAKKIEVKHDIGGSVFCTPAEHYAIWVCRKSKESQTKLNLGRIACRLGRPFEEFTEHSTLDPELKIGHADAHFVRRANFTRSISPDKAQTSGLEKLRGGIGQASTVRCGPTLLG